MTNWLNATCGITDPAIHTALAAQGLTTIPDYQVLEDGIKEVAKNCRSPGGQSLNPQYDPTQPHLQPLMVTNRGVTLGFSTERMLDKVWCYARYLLKTQRPFVANEATMDRLDAVHDYHIQVKREGDDETIPARPEKLLKDAQARACIDAFESWLSNTRGIDGVPLSYVIRPNPLIPENRNPPETDPGFGLPSIEEDLIRRASHTGGTYRADNKKVFTELMTMIPMNSIGWSYIQSFKRANNGRDAFISCKNQFLGATHTKKILSQADAVLAKAFFAGTKRNLKLEDVLRSVRQAYNDKADNGEPVPESQQIRDLQRQIQDPSLSAAMATIMANPDLSDSWDKATAYLTTMNSTAQDNEKSRKIATVDSKKGGDKSKRIRGGGKYRYSKGGKPGNKKPVYYDTYDPKDPLRPLTAKAWKALDEATKDKLRAAKAQRDHSKNKTIAALQRKIAQLSKASTAELTDEDDEEMTDVGIGTRMNGRNKKSKKSE